MRTYIGRIKEVRLDGEGVAGWIACPLGAIPSPGQYLLARAPIEVDAPLAVPLFAGEVFPQGFLALPPLPASWVPGTRLELRGPLGRGFDLPANSRRLALVALGDSVARLSPLVAPALAQGAAIALFTNASLPALPAAIESYPLGALPEALSWPDFLAMDIPVEALPGLRTRLGLGVQDPLPCPAQALILTAMPCGGVAECGVCAVPARRGWKMACKDGPVFDLDTLDW